MKTLAAFVIAIWTAHLPLCALAEDHARSASHHDAPSALAHEHATQDDVPARDSKEQESCLEHCQELLQAVPANGQSADSSVVYSGIAIPVPWSHALHGARADRFDAVRSDRAPPLLLPRRDILRL